MASWQADGGGDRLVRVATGRHVLRRQQRSGVDSDGAIENPARLDNWKVEQEGDRPRVEHGGGSTEQGR